MTVTEVSPRLALVQEVQDFDQLTEELVVLLGRHPVAVVVAMMDRRGIAVPRQKMHALARIHDIRIGRMLIPWDVRHEHWDHPAYRPLVTHERVLQGELAHPHPKVEKKLIRERDKFFDWLQWNSLCVDYDAVTGFDTVKRRPYIDWLIRDPLV